MSASALKVMTLLKYTNIQVRNVSQLTSQVKFILENFYYFCRLRIRNRHQRIKSEIQHRL
jgi:hypothetical protein